MNLSYASEFSLAKKSHTLLHMQAHTEIKQNMFLNLSLGLFYMFSPSLSLCLRYTRLMGPQSSCRHGSAPGAGSWKLDRLTREAR